MSVSRWNRPQAMPAQATLHRATILAAIAVAFSVPASAFAQSTDSAPAADGTLPAIKVQAAAVEELPGDLSPTYAGGQVARGADYGVLGKQRNIDMPFSMTTYTAKLIKDQQARTLADVVENDPSVRTAYGYGNFSEVFVIRGFQLNADDISINGLYGVTPRQLVSTAAVERVDVFKGANAFLNGASPTGSAIGGGVNVQLKRAEDTPTTNVTLATSGSGEFGAQVDVGRRFGSEGQFGIRVNQANRDGETSIDGEHRRDNTTAVALDWRGDKLRLSGDFLYQREHVSDGRPVVYFTDAIPAVPPATYNYAQNWSYTNLEDTVGILKAEYDFLPGWTAYATGGVRRTVEQGEYYSPTYSSTGVTGARLGVPYNQNSTSAEVGVRGRFDTGPVSHLVAAGGAITSENTNSAWTYAFMGPVSLYNTVQTPYPATTMSGGNLADPGMTATTVIRSVSASDTLGFLHDRVMFTVGARRQQIATANYDNTGIGSGNYSDGITTPLFGLVLRPTQNVSIFANRSEALAASSIAPAGTLNYGQQLAPVRTKQWEVGVKYDTERLGASFAAFQIEQPSAFTDPATHIYGLNGNERHRGLEAEVHGEPLKGLRLLAGASLMDATLENTQGGTYDGNRPVGVPTFLFNLGADYDIPMVPGLAVNARWIHTGAQEANAANTLSIPSWNRFDLGARYETSIYGKRTTLRATVQNVTNKAYWSAVSAYGATTYLTQGAPRTFLLSVSTDF
ncbi:TonB-dependent siderophore receptor [Paraburkholderia sp. 31.1]|uniref:TonB-dependent receptor n=1 Tax=Paraburkholderia sp. 31.1 TaxID=2615205 RepID=UPI0016567675|nr:TonB-dependent siderophore receptor [Paraburkholderia sp. 31.1]